MGAPVPVVCRQRHRHRSCSAHASAPSHSGSAAQTLLRPGCVGACTNQHGSRPGPIPSADTPSHCHPPSSLASAVTLISASLVCARPAKGRCCRPQRGAAELLEAAPCFAHALHACAGVCLARDRGATQETQEGRRRRRGQGRGRGQGQGGRRHGRRRLLHAIVDLEGPRLAFQVRRRRPWRHHRPNGRCRHGGCAASCMGLGAGSRRKSPLSATDMLNSPLPSLFTPTTPARGVLRELSRPEPSRQQVLRCREGRRGGRSTSVARVEAPTRVARCDPGRGHLC